MNLKKFLFLCVLSINGTSALFAASAPPLIFGTLDTPIAPHTTIDPNDESQLTRAIEVMSEEKAIEFFKNYKGEVHYGHAIEAAQADKASARERKPTLCKMIIDKIEEDPTFPKLTQEDFEKQSTDLEMLNLYLCLGYKPSENFIRIMIRFKRKAAIQLCLEYHAIPASSMLCDYLIEQDLCKEKIPSMFEQLSKKERKKILSELPSTCSIKANLESADSRLGELKNSSHKKNISKISGNVLIPLATALICSYDYYSFTPKEKRVKETENQETSEKREEKPSKLKAYLADLKGNPLSHKKLLVSLPVGILGIIALNTI